MFHKVARPYEILPHIFLDAVMEYEFLIQGYNELLKLRMREYLARYTGKLSRRSVVGIAAGQLRGRSLSLSRLKNFHFSILSKSVLRSTQPHIQWVLDGGGGLFPWR
jgi:hypothetical protein